MGITFLRNFKFSHPLYYNALQKYLRVKNTKYIYSTTFSKF